MQLVHLMHVMVAVVAICLAVLPIIVVPDDTSSSSEEEINNGKISIRQRRLNQHQPVRRGRGHSRLRNRHKSCRSCSSTHAARGTNSGLPHAPVQNTMKETIIRNTASKSGGVLNQLLSVNRQQMKSSKINHKSPDDRFPDEDSCEDSPENGKCKRRPKTDSGKGKEVGKPGDGGHDEDTDTNGGGHGGKKTEIPRIATDKVPSTLLPCVPGQPITRPSLPEIPAQFNLLSKKLQRIIGGKAGNKNRVGKPCIPVVTTKNPSEGEKTTVKFNDIPSPTTPCVIETIPVTWPYLPEIPAQVKDIYDRVIRAIGARTADDKVSSRCVPYHSTKEPMTSMADENGVSIGYDVGRVDGDDITTSNDGDVKTTSLPPCVPEIPVTRPYLPEIPAQIRYFYERILRVSGAKSRRKSDQARCVTHVAASDEPVTNNGRGNEEGGEADDTATDTNRDDVAEETTSSPPCIPEVPITQPYLPELPAQLRKLTDKMLLLIGVESNTKSSCITRTTTPQLHHTAPSDDHQEEVSTVLESSSRLPDDTQATKTKAPEDSLPELPAQLKKAKYK